MISPYQNMCKCTALYDVAICSQNLINYWKKKLSLKFPNELVWLHNMQLYLVSNQYNHFYKTGFYFETCPVYPGVVRSQMGVVHAMQEIN